jgi:hypothetical protein
MRCARILVGSCLGLALISALPRVAAAEPVAVKSGKVTLAITGLAIELPKDARKSATWLVSGSWSLSNEGKSYDGRDVIDQKVGGKLVRGNWIHVGYFDAGECAAVVKEMEVTERWTGAADLYGAHFAAAGGMWTFEGELGTVPAIALCTPGPRGQSLLLYHFFLQPGAPVGEAGLAALAKDKLLERVTKAWKAAKAAPVEPTHRPEIRRRGDQAAARTVRLGRSELDVALPDDGYVWLARTGGEDEASDFLDRMAPSLPDSTLEVARVKGQGCSEVLSALLASATTVSEPPPLGVPVLWTAYPTILVDARHERVICRDVGGGALIVGLLGDPPAAEASRDFGPFALVLQALADAAAK